MNNRIIGFDIARALAIFGMVIVNFKVVMNANTGNDFLLYTSSLLQGRASALFVILAGVGISLLSKKVRVSQHPSALIQMRYSIVKRGLLLIAIGLAYTPIWPADILHFYGCYFLIAALVFNSKTKKLLWLCSVFIALFPLLLLVFDYDQGWNWLTLEYLDFWTFDGMVRHLLFNGFHPVFPWCAFLIFGLWLGRQQLTLSEVKLKFAAVALVTLVTTEFFIIELRTNLLADIAQGHNFALTVEEVEVLVSTTPMPPMPAYIIAAGSSAVLIILGCLQLGQSFSNSKISQWLASTGKLSLSLYVAHVIIGMGMIEAMGYLSEQTISFALSCAAIFCLLSIVFSVFWLKQYKKGPLEWLFYKLAS